MITERKIAAVYDASTTVPLYLYEAEHESSQQRGLLGGGRSPNLKPDFTRYVSERLGLRFVPDGKGNLDSTFGPEDLFAYLYAILYAPSYRARYATFLKTDFPRLPITSKPDLFRRLVGLGSALTNLHLMQVSGPDQPTYPVAGSDRVEKVGIQ